MQIDFYRVKAGALGQRADVDLEHEVPKVEAVALAKCGDVIVMKLWLRTKGTPADLERLEAAIADAVQPLGVV